LPIGAYPATTCGGKVSDGDTQLLENVCGALNSHDGTDFATICDGFQQAGYAVGAMVVDAEFFVPQSRPRLFIIGAHEDVQLPEGLIAKGPLAPWHTRTLKTAHEKLAPKTKRGWIWWNLPAAPKRTVNLADVIEENPSSPLWFTAEETQYLLDMMSPIKLRGLRS